MNKIKAFNKYNPSELINQLVTTLHKQPKREKSKMDSIIKDLKNISSDIFKELKKPVMAKVEVIKLSNALTRSKINHVIKGDDIIIRS